MTSQDIADSAVVSLANLPATAQQRRSVFAVAAILTAAFAGIAPFSATRLPQFPAFIPTFEAIIFVNDLITSILLIAQYTIVPSTALLALASGYLFTALIVIPHALTFPGAFSPSGLLGAGAQSAAWLFFFWHFGTAVAVLAYAYLKDADDPKSQKQASNRSSILWSVAIVCSLVIALAWMTTAENRYLPIIFQDATRFELGWFGNRCYLGDVGGCDPACSSLDPSPIGARLLADVSTLDVDLGTSSEVVPLCGTEWRLG